MIAIRGAITVDKNDKEEIISSSAMLLQEIISQNEIVESDIVSIVFSMTSDLNKAFPARGAVRIGLHDTPLFCVKELDIEDALPKCIRVLIHVSKYMNKSDVVHVYLKGASVLRPDLINKNNKS